MSKQTPDPALLAVQLHNGRTVEEELRHLGQLARLLDSRFSLFGVKFGFDSLLGLVPVVGDITTGAAGLYALYTAIRLRLHPFATVQIAWNLLIDTVLGAIPLAGDVFDVFFRSNTKNFKVVEKHLTRKAHRHVKRAAASKP